MSRHVPPTSRGDKSLLLFWQPLTGFCDMLQRIMASFAQDNFNANLCFRDRILSLQFCRRNTLYKHAQWQNQIRNLCDLSRRQTPVARTKICTKIIYLVHTKQFVAATCYCDMLPRLFRPFWTTTISWKKMIRFKDFFCFSTRCIIIERSLFVWLSCIRNWTLWALSSFGT